MFLGRVARKNSRIYRGLQSIADITKNIPLVLHGHKEIDFAVAILCLLIKQNPFLFRWIVFILKAV